MREDIERGLELLQQRKLKEAKDIFEEILLDDPSDVEALCNIGIAFTELGENEKARKALSYCLKIDERNPDALEAMGCAFLRMDEYTEAKKYLEKALDLSAENASVLRNLGVLYSKMGEAERCYACLQKSALIDPDDYLTQYALASAHAYFRRYAESRTILERLVINDEAPEDIRSLAEEDLKRLEKLV